MTASTFSARLGVLASVALAACASPGALAHGHPGATGAQRPDAAARIARRDAQTVDVPAQIAAPQPPPLPNNPRLSLGNVTPGPGQRVVLIPAVLSEAPKQTTLVRWGTMNGFGTWSGPGGHYTAASGSLLFQPGETRKTIPVTLLKDLAPGQTIKVAITAKPIGATVVHGNAFIIGGGTTPPPPAPVDTMTLPPKPAGMTLAWSQDFAAPDFAMSSTGRKADGSPAWQSRLTHGMTQDGNKELGLYAPPDVFPKVTMTGLDATGKRFIQLERHPEGFIDPATGDPIVHSWDKKPYTYSSAILQGSKFPPVIKLGSYVEARLKLELKGQTWPAFWLLPVKGWPPEFDILELFLRGISQPTVISTTLHYTDGKGAKTGYGVDVPVDLAVPGFDFRNWHTYGVHIERNWFTVYVDDVPIFRVVNPTKPDTLWYPLFDITTGGFLGEPAPDAPLPAKMGLDWFKVWN